MKKLYYAQLETTFHDKTKPVTTYFQELDVLEEDEEKYIVYLEDLEETTVYKDMYDPDEFMLNKVKNPYAGLENCFDGENFEIAVFSSSHNKAVDLLKKFIKKVTVNQIEESKNNEVEIMKYLKTK